MYTLTEIEKFIELGIASLNYKKEPSNLYNPLEYILSLGGKRLRPKICLTTYTLFSDTINNSILYPALALEVFHNFTLIHDDIMDKAPLRRGQPTVHNKWGNNIAILSGDVMCISSYELLANTPKEHLPAVLSLFTKTATQVCEGQQFDMNFESQPIITMDEYISMIGLKTAVLIACSAKMGAIIAGAEEKTAQAIYDIAYQIGVAFQIQDDLFDTYGERNLFGKSIGGDILNNKKTWLLVESFRAADSTTANQIRDILNMPIESGEAKIEAMKSIYDKLSVKEKAEVEIDSYFTRALNILKDTDLTNTQKEQLEYFAQTVVSRKK